MYNLFRNRCKINSFFNFIKLTLCYTYRCAAYLGLTACRREKDHFSYLCGLCNDSVSITLMIWIIMKITIIIILFYLLKQRLFNNPRTCLPYPVSCFSSSWQKRLKFHLLFYLNFLRGSEIRIYVSYIHSRTMYVVTMEKNMIPTIPKT